MFFALECQAQFLFEKRTEPYMKYGEGVSEKKAGAKDITKTPGGYPGGRVYNPKNINRVLL
jgi:hypothetical protein